MAKSTLYSIGHGNKSIEAFISELKWFGIQFLLDIRSKPYSKWNPHFNQEYLKFELKQKGVTYVFAGDTLGGLPTDRSCYDSEGKVVYDLVQKKDFFKNGLSRLITANQNNIYLAIMCSETKPEECHRSKLVGQELLKKGITLNHILPGQIIKDQHTVINELQKGKSLTNLFNETEPFKSRNTY